MIKSKYLSRLWIFLLVLLTCSGFFLFIPTKKIFAADIPSQKDLKGTETLFIYLKVDPLEKKVNLEKIEAKYGFASENRYPTNQVVKVIKEKEVIFQTSFQLENEVEIWPEEGPVIERAEGSRVEIITVPYVKGSKIIIEDRQANEQGIKETYLSIAEEIIESFNPAKQLRLDFETKVRKEKAKTEDKITILKGEEKTGREVAPLEILKIEAEKKVPLQPKNFLAFFQTILNFFEKIFWRDGKVKGLSSSPRNLSILFVTGKSCSFWGQQFEVFTEGEFEAAVREQMQKIMSIPPYSEFINRMSSARIMISQPLSFTPMMYPQDCPGQKCPYTCNPQDESWA